MQALREHLFSKVPTVVMTSATLSIGGQAGFAHFQQRLGLEGPGGAAAVPESVDRRQDAEVLHQGGDVFGVVAQRLVRRVCEQCKEANPTSPPALIQAGFTPEEAETVTPMKGTGCDRCNNTGYKGRVGLYEVLEVTEELRELILVGASGLELRRKAIDEGMITLRRSGLRGSAAR